MLCLNESTHCDKQMLFYYEEVRTFPCLYMYIECRTCSDLISTFKVSVSKVHVYNHTITQYCKSRCVRKKLCILIIHLLCLKRVVVYLLCIQFFFYTLCYYIFISIGKRFKCCALFDTYNINLHHVLVRLTGFTVNVGYIVACYKIWYLNYKSIFLKLNVYTLYNYGLDFYIYNERTKWNYLTIRNSIYIVLHCIHITIYIYTPKWNSY